jgi:transposase
MPKTPAEMPDTIEDLRALVVLQQENHKVELSERNEEISQLREYIRLLKSQRFGSSSERSPSSQMGLFNEAEILCDEEDGGGGDGGEQADGEASAIEVPAHTRSKRGGRRPLPAFLPREEILHDLSEDSSSCRPAPRFSFISAPSTLVLRVRTACRRLRRLLLRFRKALPRRRSWLRS